MKCMVIMGKKFVTVHVRGDTICVDIIQVLTVVHVKFLGTLTKIAVP